ncbi:MAG: prolyl oligopeptidase family serine peptidase [Bacteroidales bacterium]
MKKTFLFLVLFCVLSIPATSQVPNQSALSIGQIMRGEDFTGCLPTSIRWSEDSRTIYFSWNPDGDTLRSTYGADRTTGDIRKLTPAETRDLPEDGDESRDHSRKVYASQGDLFLLDRNTSEVRRITNTLERESDPQFSGDQGSVIYRAGNNLYRWSIGDGSTTQLTNFVAGAERSEPTGEQEAWLERDQMAVIGILAERKGEEESRKTREKALEFSRPKAVYLENRQLREMDIAPDLRHVVYHVVVPAGDRNTQVPDYVTGTGYTRELPARAKVGGPQDRHETWIFDRERDTAYRVDPTRIPGIRDKPAYLREYAKDPSAWVDTFEQAREVIIGRPVFSDGGRAVVDIHSEDQKDRWIMTLDRTDGTLRPIDRQHDDAWIGGPGIGWMDRGALGWIDESTVWFQSEESGYSHLYTADVSDGTIRALTRGEFEIQQVRLSRDRKTFYVTSNKQSPFEQHFYHLPAKGGPMVQITRAEGGHEVTLSPDEAWLAVRFSTNTSPWELYVMPNRPGADMKQVTESTTEAFRAYPWQSPEIVFVPARDGARVPASLYKPRDGKGNGAAVLFVHGAGYLQNVHRWWPSYYREHMFHQLLADNGFTVLALDFRASSGYGRDWRTAIYRHMGGADLDDQVDGAAYLVEEMGVDAGRIGIYGGSYGGFLTLMALCTSPGTFRSGAALRSVTDWAHYNHGYTSAILNTPVEDSLAYRRSSPIYYAEGLEGNLLMLHGMVDTNVHFQDIVRLSQRFIELEKENWELAVFPMEGHGFREASSWTDEYRRIYKLFLETLTEAGPPVK